MMNTQSITCNNQELPEWQKQLGEYLVDTAQRSIIFTDILRKRGNDYIKHLSLIHI